MANIKLQGHFQGSPALTTCFSAQFREEMRIQWTLPFTKLLVLSSVDSLQIQFVNVNYMVPQGAETQP